MVNDPLPVAYELNPGKGGFQVPNFKIFQDQPDHARVTIYSPSGVAMNINSAGEVAITSAGLAVTGTLAVAGATTDTSTIIANNSSTAGGGADAYNVLNLSAFTLAVENNSTAANAQALVKLQISPDAVTWTDNTAYTTLNTGSLVGLVSDVFMKYARVYYAAVSSASAITLSVFLQGHS